MADATIEADGNSADKTPRRPSMKLATALVIGVVAAAIAIGTTIYLLRDDQSTGVEALLAAVALVAFGVAAYGLMQAVLAVIDAAGERRRQDREVSERRKGARARQPRP